jgi:uncharacterized protein (DUF302 family)
MLHIVETAKDVETAARDLEEAAKRNTFGVLHIHDLQQKMKESRISVYEEGGRTKIATMLPTAMLALFPGSAELRPVAEDVERAILRIIDEGK